ncbi:hypothetical protein [Herbiconiux daphne]|uniref:Uncharacterized protein n=2 Tax=Micrococcales TaxID=85006 RepID=A0ABT2H901_9MICO|nr:hypothetical protein [Herbiconiux daphne]MCS5736382.1 hypothetical protein [Herbiconiux daphne]
MLLTLFTVTDADNVIGKTMQEITRMDIFLKRDVDISSPVLILIPDLPTGFDNINYAEIPALKRYYFIDSITSLGGELWELRLRCDVLETYKPDILSSVARFTRKIKTGDCIDINVDTCVYKTITKHDCDRELTAGRSMILTTI